VEGNSDEVEDEMEEEVEDAVEDDQPLPDQEGTRG
jgi:hypothetical protein